MLLLPDQFTPGFALPGDIGISADAAPYWFIFAGQRLLVIVTPNTDSDRPSVRVPSGPDWPLADHDDPNRVTALRKIYMGCWRGHHCLAAEVASDYTPPEGCELYGLRDAWGTLDDALIGLAGQGLQLIDWDRSHQFCGRCGEPTVARDNERSRHCEHCRQNHYPRVAPAIMVRITRGDDILLARSARFATGMYSVLAGFVDPGETLEQAVHREIGEEVSLEVSGLRYLTSQPWPFPHSLMIAFSAEYLSGEIFPADGEIEHAAWFNRASMPKIPPTMSIARRLIDGYLSGD